MSETSMLQQRDAILEAVAFAAERFLMTPDWRAHIQDVLARLGQRTNSSHVYIFENHHDEDGELVTSMRYEWAAPGIPPDLHNPLFQHVLIHDSKFIRWAETLSRGQLFQGNLQTFLPTETEVLVPRGIKSLLDVPIIVNGHWWGIIGFDDYDAVREWSPAETEALKIAAGIISAAIHRQRSDSALRLSEERYRLVSSVISDYTFSSEFDEQGRLHMTWVTGAFAAITGYSLEECIARGGWTSLVHPDDLELDAQAMAHLHSNRPLVNELRIIHKDQSIRWVRVYAHPAWDAEKTQLVGIYGAVQDVTERKGVEAEREQLIRELEARNTELERFTYTVSHDLKSPLITIGGFLGFLEKDALAGNIVRLQADIQRIKEAADKMRHLLDDLLELSRIGRLMNPPRQVPFAEIVAEALALVGGQLGARGVAVDVAPDLPSVYGDRVRLVELLQNLIDNAAKFMGDQLQPRIVIGVREQVAERVFFVQDNGIGIVPAYQQKIFGLFEKLDAAAVGTGIGLALVKRIVEVHGGRIWAESQGDGCGTTFCFTLPDGPRE
jgi:PAS domain S-box-containing protein